MKKLFYLFIILFCTNSLISQNIEIVVNSYNGSLPYWGSWGHPILVLESKTDFIKIDLPEKNLPIGEESLVKKIELKYGEYSAYYDTYQSNAPNGMGKTNWSGKFTITKETNKLIIKTTEKKTFWGKESSVSVYVED